MELLKAIIIEVLTVGITNKTNKINDDIQIVKFDLGDIVEKAALIADLAVEDADLAVDVAELSAEKKTKEIDILIRYKLNEKVQEIQAKVLLDRSEYGKGNITIEQYNQTMRRSFEVNLGLQTLVDFDILHRR